VHSDLLNMIGQRKYLNTLEIQKFVSTSREFDRDTHLFCMVMAYTGCRISEGLSLTVKNFDLNVSQVAVKCLKKRGRTIYRTIPLPRHLLNALARWFRSPACPTGRLWPWSRMTAYRRICDVMWRAGIVGDHATPKGLRHGFGVKAIQAGVPLPLVQRWLGHADVKTTTIYTRAVGPEERSIANKMWNLGDADERPRITVPPAAKTVQSVGLGYSGLRFRISFNAAGLSEAQSPRVLRARVMGT